MKNIVFFIFILFIFNIFNSCSDELITIVDEYNPPYQIKAIPGDNSISINFWSGVLASDFVGFNLYAGTSPSFNQPTDAISNSEGGYPTVKVSTHVRSNVTLTLPPMNGGVTYNNGTLYYVTVTAYGTNELLESKYIETKISSVVPVVPREEGTSPLTGNNITVNGGTTVATIDTTTQKITCQTGWQMQYFGIQTNLNAVVVITNNVYRNDSPYANNGLYIFSNNNQNNLAKVWITSAGNYRWAYHSQGNLWAGI